MLCRLALDYAAKSVAFKALVKKKKKYLEIQNLKTKISRSGINM